jgi:multimeric flavodoxin WrbA
MNIIAINGSPHRSGSGAVLISAVLAAARKNGRTAEVINLYDKKIRGCLACNKCKDATPDCVVGDDMAAIAKKIIAADAVIISSPVYLGHVTGEMKTFLDRWCRFFDRGFKIRDLRGKKLVTIVTSGAPAKAYGSVTKYLTGLLAGFFGMKLVGSLQAGDLSAADAGRRQKALMKRAEKFGSRL